METAGGNVHTSLCQRIPYHMGLLVELLGIYILTSDNHPINERTNRGVSRS